ncbi:MAG: DUF4345 family protein [Pseudomonadales bacterium]
MSWVYRALIALMILLFAIMGAGFYLDPVRAAGRIGLEAMNLTGMNAIHGDLGGLFVGMALLLVLGLLRPASAWLLAVAALLATIALGRLLGFALTGSNSDDALMALGVEVICVLILILGSRRLASE